MATPRPLGKANIQQTARIAITDADKRKAVPLSNQYITPEGTLHSLTAKQSSNKCFPKSFVKSKVLNPLESDSNSESPCATVDLSIKFESVEIDWVDGKINKHCLKSAYASSIQVGTVLILVKCSAGTVQSFYGCSLKTSDENACLIMIGPSLVSIQQNMFSSKQKYFEYNQNKVIYHICEKSEKIVLYRYHSCDYLEKVVPDTYPVQLFRNTLSTNDVHSDLYGKQLNEDNLLIGLHAPNRLNKYLSPITFSKSCQTVSTSSTATQTDFCEDISLSEYSHPNLSHRTNHILSFPAEITSSSATIAAAPLIRVISSNTTSLQPTSSTASLAQRPSSTTTLSQRLYSTIRSMHRLSSTVSLIKAISNTDTPMQTVSRITTPIQTLSNTARSVQRVSRTTTPIQTLSSTARSVQRVSRTTTPIQTLSSTARSVQRLSSTTLPKLAACTAATSITAISTAASSMPAISAAACTMINMSNNAPLNILMPRVDAPMERMSIAASPVNAMSTALQSNATTTATPEMIAMITGAVPAKALASGTATTQEMFTFVSPTPTVPPVAPLVEEMPAATPSTKEMSSIPPITEISPAAPLINEVSISLSRFHKVSSAAPHSNRIYSASPPINEIFTSSRPIPETCSESVPCRKSIAESLVKDTLVESLPLQSPAATSLSVDAFDEPLSCEDCVNELLPFDGIFVKPPPAEESFIDEPVADSFELSHPSDYLVFIGATIENPIYIDSAQTVPTTKSAVPERPKFTLTTSEMASSNIISADKSVSKANIPNTSNDNHPISTRNPFDVVPVNRHTAMSSFKQEFPSPFIIDGLQCSSPTQDDVYQSSAEIEKSPHQQLQQEHLLKSESRHFSSACNFDILSLNWNHVCFSDYFGCYFLLHTYIYICIYIV